MCLYGARSRVVWQHCYGNRLIPVLNLLIYWSDDTAVKILYSLDFQINVALMASLVTCLHVQEYKVITALKCVNGSLCLAFIVCIIKACCALHVNVLKSCVYANSFYKVNRRYHRAPLNSKFLRQCLHTWLVAWRPHPDAVGRVFALCHTLKVNRVVFKQLLCL